MTPAEKLARALEKTLVYVRGAYECAFPDEDENREVEQEATEALAAWRSQQAANVMRAPLPKGLAMLPSELRAAIHAYAEEARQRGMEQERALWKLAESSQEIEAAPKAPAMPDHVALAIDALKPHGNAHVRVLLAWLSSTGLTKE